MNVFNNLMKKKKFWDFYARIYDLLRTFSPYVKMQKKVIEYLQLIPNLTILDASCGTGNTIEELVKTSGKPWGIKIFGLDQSSAMLTRAKKKLDDSASFFSPGTYDNIPGAKKYDRIISVNSLYASDDPRKTLEHWYGRLEDGGLLVISNPFLPKQGPIWREFWRDTWRNKDAWELIKFIIRSPIWILLIILNRQIAHQARQKTFYFLGPDALRDMLIAVGFQILQQEIVYGDGSILITARKDEGASIRRAQTPEEIEEIFRLRYNVYYLETGMVDEVACPDSREIDWFDDFATYFIAREKGKIVGCVRYFPDTSRGFLLEEYFPLPLEITDPEVRRLTIETSRVIVLPECRSSRLFLALLEIAVSHGLSQGYSCFIGAATEMLWRALSRNGWQIKICGDYKEYHNTISAPALARPPFEKRNDNSYKNYISSPGYRIFSEYFPGGSSI